MRPIKGRALQRPSGIKQLWEEAVHDRRWVMQPKVNGDRAILAVVDGKVYVQNRYAERYRQKVANAGDFLKLPDRTCLDGEVFKGSFYPFEVLACNGKNLLRTVVQERVQWARDLVRMMSHPWLYETPSVDWLMRRGKNAPNYDGVVLKRADSVYLILGSATQTSLDWMKRLWA
jgi:ATP-dependent DNA ligase